MSTPFEEQLQLLACVPCFDSPTAADLLSYANVADGEDADPHDRAERVISALGRSGLTVRYGASRRIVEPLRTELRQGLLAKSPQLYRTALGVFARHAQNGSAVGLREVMGDYGARLNVAALQAVSEPQNDRAFDEMVDLVRSRTDSEEAQSALSAAAVIETYAVQADRRTYFLRGLAAWVQGDRLEGEQLFRRVLSDRRIDKATAIAAHLVGVSRHSDGNLAEARDLVQDSVDILREVGDDRGLVMALTTLGRVQLDTYRETGESSMLDAALGSLELARDIEPPRESETVRLLIALSVAYVQSRNYTAALNAAELAPELASSPNDSVAALMNLAVILRESGKESSVDSVLRRALTIASEGQLQDTQHARLLNILAARERRVGSLDDARLHARESLAMGRRLSDHRHVAHAGHTLATIYMDLAERGTDDASAMLSRAESLLDESLQILTDLRSSRSVALVSESQRRLRSMQRDLERTMTAEQDPFLEF